MKITFEDNGRKLEWDLPYISPTDAINNLEKASVSCISLDFKLK